MVEIYHNFITRELRCAPGAYDLANHRWYRLEVEAEVLDNGWLSSTVARHLKEHYEPSHPGTSQKRLPPGGPFFLW